MEQPEDRIRKVATYGKQVDFGKAASDYGRYRAGYPDELYRRLVSFGVGLLGQRILDLGAGTGFLGRGFARNGCHLTAQRHLNATDARSAAPRCRCVRRHGLRAGQSRSVAVRWAYFRRCRRRPMLALVRSPRGGR